LVELLNDYGYEILYHPDKGNVVPDAFGRKEQAKTPRVRALGMKIHTSLMTQICDAQHEVFKEQNWKNESLRGMDNQMETKSNDTRHFMNQI
jgi:hypothetical protein